MNDEKRQTRLLPFRLRGKGAAARRASDAAGARADDVPADEELNALLGAWQAPEPSHAAPARLLAAFREQTRSREPFWKRALTASVRVPAPVAACAVVALVASMLALSARAPRLALDAPAALPQAPLLKIIEAPATHERDGVRVLNVAKENRRGRKPGAARRASLAREGVATGAKKPAADEGPTNYFTRVDMGEFQPSEDMKFRIIKRGKADED